MVKQFYKSLIDAHKRIVEDKIALFEKNKSKKTSDEILEEVMLPIHTAIAEVTKQTGIQPQAGFYDTARKTALKQTPGILPIGRITKGNFVRVSQYFYRLLNRRANDSGLGDRLTTTKWYWYVLTVAAILLTACLPIYWWIKLMLVLGEIGFFIAKITPPPVFEANSYTHYNMIDMAFGENFFPETIREYYTSIDFPNLSRRGTEVLNTMTASGIPVYCITPQEALELNKVRQSEKCNGEAIKKADQPIFYTIYNDIVVFLHGWPVGTQQIQQEISHLDSIIKDNEIKSLMELVKTSQSTFEKVQETKIHDAFPKTQQMESVSNDVLYGFLRNVATLQTLQVNMDSMQNNRQLSNTRDMYVVLKEKIIVHTRRYLSTYNKYVADYTFLLEKNVDTAINQMLELVSKVVYQPEEKVIDEGTRIL